MEITKKNRPAQYLFSLKWRALLIFSLLLIGINSFLTFYVSRNLLSQFEQERKSIYAKQLKELDGMVRQSSSTLLALSNTVPDMSGMAEQLAAGTTENAVKAFERQWPSMQLGASIDAAQIYSADSKLIRSWKSEDIDLPDPELIRSSVQEVNKLERPLTLLDCAKQCIQFSAAPMLAKNRNTGVIVLGSTLAEGIVYFKEISGVDIGVLNISKNEQPANGGDDRNIANWHARVSALTNLEQNLDLLQSVAAQQRSLPGLDTGLRKTSNGHEFEIHFVPIERFSVRGNAYFVLIEDITQSLSLIQQSVRRELAIGAIGLLLSESLLLLILWGPLSRLKRTTDILPLLARNDFEKIRQAVSGTRRKGWYKDEFDMLDDTLVSVSQQLENLQAEVARRAAALNEVNLAISRMNEILEQKVKERTLQLTEANVLMEHLNEELEQKVNERTRQLLEAQEELVRKEKLAVLGQVAGSVGHELRNPLGVISNAVYFLQTVLTDADETTKEYLNIIREEVAGSERIVSDLLDAVRTKLPNTEIVGARALIEQALGKFSIPSSVPVKLDVPETMSSLRVDPQQIEQVLRNLISNGLEAMPEGGTLEIRAVENKQGGTISISVCDTGIGMAPEVLPKLFQPLFTTKARGIGLGLVVVKNLTKANGGTVKVESEAGKGTVFTITLPAVEERVS